MKSLPKSLTTLAACLLVFVGAAGAEPRPPAEGGQLPAMKFAVPENPRQQRYLGVAGKKTFTIPEIAAEVVIIEIFSMY